MKTTLSKSYSPCSEGYSLVTTRYRDQIHRWIEAEGVTYREWDVNPYTKGVNRGTEWIVSGSDGSAYWTGDHYDTFLLFRGPTG